MRKREIRGIRVKGDVVMEVEVVVMCFEDKEPTSQGMWAPSRIWAEPGNRFSLEPLEGASKSDTDFSAVRSGTPDLENSKTRNLCCLKPQSIW